MNIPKHIKLEPRYDNRLTLDDLKAITRAFGGAVTVDDMFQLAENHEKQLTEALGYRWSVA